MPTVDGTEFPYTKAGIQKAKAWAEMTGKPLEMKEYHKGGQLDPSSLEEVAHKPIEKGTRQAVRYKAKTKGGDERHLTADIEGLTNKEMKRQLNAMALREQIKANPEFADTVSSAQAAQFMNMRDKSLWDMLRSKFQEGGEVFITSKEDSAKSNKRDIYRKEITQKAISKNEKDMELYLAEALLQKLGVPLIRLFAESAAGKKKATLQGKSIPFQTAKDAFNKLLEREITGREFKPKVSVGTIYKKGGKVKMPKGYHT